MPAFYRQHLAEFLVQPADQIVGRLTNRAADAGFFQQSHAQTTAWVTEIESLKPCVERLLGEFAAAAWQILLEYPIPRRGKRIDAVILADSVILVLEFKCGASQYPRDAIAQVEDYGLDLGDFHKESFGRVMVPFLVATEASIVPPPTSSTSDLLKLTWFANARDLPDKLVACLRHFRDDAATPIDPDRWDASDYNPTPSIIEAAQALYAGQNVREISRCQAGIENLTRTTDAVIAIVDGARERTRKRIVFVTGVPGAGKTLAGLNIVHNKQLHDGDLGVFLSGNGPLVRVLTEALARDASTRLAQPLAQSRRKVNTFIQNVHRFIDEYFSDPTKIPVDKVVVFDEAQRAWDAAQSARKFNRPFSEPEILLEVMDRHPDWAVVVALIGSGQEINRGEAGLSEWGRALSSRFPHWEVSIAPDLKAGTHPSGACLFPGPPPGIAIAEDPSLHLSINLRSYKAEVLSDFVDALLKLDPHEARRLKEHLARFPLVIVRDLEDARAWLRRRRRGHRRIGLLASSGARRLRAHGLDVTADLDVENWFLNGPDDVRSSHYLEQPATEFGVQGLELDWTGLCWGGDLHPHEGRWVGRSFRGTRWQRIHDELTMRYVVNKYRVLLTRAREGTVIWVPRGNPDDPTRPPQILDEIAAYLTSCGIEPPR